MQTRCSKHPTSHSSATVCLTVFSQMFSGRAGRMWEVMGLMKMSWILSFLLFLFPVAFPFSCAVISGKLANLSSLYVCVCVGVGGGPTCVDLCVTFRTSTVVAVLLLELQETFMTSSLPGTSGVAETNCCSSFEVDGRELICTHGCKNLVHSFQKH